MRAEDKPALANSKLQRRPVPLEDCAPADLAKEPARAATAQELRPHTSALVVLVVPAVLAAQAVAVTGAHMSAAVRELSR
jgi:hypothetical protein